MDTMTLILQIVMEKKMASIAMMCEDPEDHKFIKKRCISNPTGRIEETFFLLVLVLVWHEEPGNYTHLIPLPGNHSLIAKSGTSSNCEILRNIAFGLLVVSTVSTSVSTSSSLDFSLVSSVHFPFCYKVTK